MGQPASPLPIPDAEPSSEHQTLLARLLAATSADPTSRVLADLHACLADLSPAEREDLLLSVEREKARLAAHLAAGHDESTFDPSSAP